MSDRGIPSSLARHIGRTATDDETLRELAATAFRQRRAVVFFPSHLDATPMLARELIMAEAKRIYGERVPGGPLR